MRSNQPYPRRSQHTAQSFAQRALCPLPFSNGRSSLSRPAHLCSISRSSSRTHAASLSLSSPPLARGSLDTPAADPRDASDGRSSLSAGSPCSISRSSSRTHAASLSLSSPPSASFKGTVRISRRILPRLARPSPTCGRHSPCCMPASPAAVSSGAWQMRPTSSTPRWCLPRTS